MAVSSEGRVALYLQDKHPIRDGMGYVKAAEAAGFEAVWRAESRLVREATVPMAAFAAVTGTSRVDAKRAITDSRFRAFFKVNKAKNL